MDMANLKPDILFIQRPWRIVDDIAKTLHVITSAMYLRKSVAIYAYLQALLKLLLLFIDNAKSEVDLVRLFKVRLHSHNLRECFLSMIERSVTVVQNPNSVPKLRLLRVVRVRGSCKGQRCPTFGSRR